VTREDRGRTNKVSMLLRANPHMPIAPLAQVPQLLDFRVRVLDIVFHGQSRGIVHAHIAAKPE
jgi:hypothetical protein